MLGSSNEKVKASDFLRVPFVVFVQSNLNLLRNVVLNLHRS